MKALRLIAIACIAVLPQAAHAADILFSLSGTVGDSNWTTSNTIPGDYELDLDLRNTFPTDNLPYWYGGGGTGPGGVLTISYSGAAIVLSNDTALGGLTSEEYQCVNLNGCNTGYNPTDWQHQFGDDANNKNGADPASAGTTSFSDTIDSTWYNSIMVPQTASYMDRAWNQYSGMTDFVIDETVAGADFGQAFSVTVSAPDTTSPALSFLETTDPVPEPASWALFLAGFGITGFAIRRTKAGHIRPAQ